MMAWRLAGQDRHFTPEADKLDFLPGDELIAIGDLILIEVLQGIRSGENFRRTRTHLLFLTVVNMLNTTIALKSAANFRALRKKGITVRKTTDSIIATYCIENNLPLLHSDRVYDPFHEHLKLKDAAATG